MTVSQNSWGLVWSVITADMKTEMKAGEGLYTQSSQSPWLQSCNHRSSGSEAPPGREASEPHLGSPALETCTGKRRSSWHQAWSQQGLHLRALEGCGKQTPSWRACVQTHRCWIPVQGSSLTIIWIIQGYSLTDFRSCARVVGIWWNCIWVLSTLVGTTVFCGTE